MKYLITVFLSLLLSSADLWAGEMLLYAIRYESPERIPDIFYTRVFALDPATKESTLIFSDRDTPIRLMNRRGEPGYPGEVVAAGGGRIFAHAVERTLNPGRWYHHQAAAVYELSADGANTVRKVLAVRGQHALAELFVSPAGDKIGYINEMEDRPYIFIHETETGSLLYKIEAGPIFRDCFAARIGWLPDGKRLFFSLYGEDEHLTSEASKQKEGSYVMNEDGQGVTMLPQSLTAFRSPAGFEPDPFMPECVGGRPGGTYIFRDTQRKKGSPGSDPLSFVYEVNPLTNARQEIPLQGSKGLNRFKLSFAGRYLAFIESPSRSDAEYVRVKDLDTGEDRRVFSFSRKPFRGDYLGLVGWMHR